MPDLEWAADSSSYYTVIFFDLDARSRWGSSLRSILHWIVVNIKGNNITSGETKAELVSIIGLKY